MTLASFYDELSERAERVTVGKTACGRNIDLFRFGEGEKHTLLVAGTHAREWITTVFCSELVLREYDGQSFDFLPCLNPDGVCLATDGLKSVSDGATRRRLLKLNGRKKDFSLWKANALGVDINVNFDADWGEGKYNRTEPGPSDCIGREAESENETKAAVNVLQNDYALLVSYHSLGEEVYWGYEHNFRHYEEAKAYADKIGYALKRSEHSCGGLKDYYALRYDGLGMTVEIGEEKYGHPYPIERTGELLQKHEGTLTFLTTLGEKIYDKLHGKGDGGSGKGVS